MRKLEAPFLEKFVDKWYWERYRLLLLRNIMKHYNEFWHSKVRLRTSLFTFRFALVQRCKPLDMESKDFTEDGSMCCSGGVLCVLVTNCFQQEWHCIKASEEKYYVICSKWKMSGIIWHPLYFKILRHQFLSKKRRPQFIQKRPCPTIMGKTSFYKCRNSSSPLTDFKKAYIGYCRCTQQLCSGYFSIENLLRTVVSLMKRYFCCGQGSFLTLLVYCLKAMNWNRKPLNGHISW